MDCLQTMRERRSIRQYKKQPVTDEQMSLILEAAQNAPSWKNQQPWSYIVLHDREQIQALKQATGGNPKGNAYENADYFLVVCADPERSGNREGKPYYMTDIGITLTQVTLAAASQGLGTCWVGAFPEQPVKQLLEIPYHIRVVAITPIGVPDEEPSARPRKPFNQWVYAESWGHPWEK